MTIGQDHLSNAGFATGECRPWNNVWLRNHFTLKKGMSDLEFFKYYHYVFIVKIYAT